ncbi:hypothetical protein D9M68_803930 [compost metagenome]
MLVRNATDPATQCQQIGLRDGGIIVYPGLHFDLGLQHLAAAALPQRVAAFLEEAAWHVPQAPAVAAHEEVFLLESEGVGVGVVRWCLRHARVISSGG